MPAWGGEGAPPLAALSGGGPPYVPLSTYERPFPLVRLRGLPFSAEAADVYDFFSGLQPVDVLMLRRDGRSTGEAYVVFGNNMQLDYALQRNRQSMGRRYIEVFRAKKTDYYAAVARHVADAPFAPQQPAFPFQMDALGQALGGEAGILLGGGLTGLVAPRPGEIPAGLGVRAQRLPLGVEGEGSDAHTGVLKMRGLPFSATKDDIIAFFDEASLGVTPLTHDSIHIVISLDGRPQGTAFAEFGCPDDARLAMRKDRAAMGSRYVELFPSSREEATRAATTAR